MSPANRPYRVVFITTVVLFGGYLLARAIEHLVAAPPDRGWLALVALAAVTSSFTVKLPSLPANLSASEAFVFSTVLLFGPAAGTITVVLDALVITFWTKGTRTSL